MHGIAFYLFLNLFTGMLADTNLSGSGWTLDSFLNSSSMPVMGGEPASHSRYIVTATLRCLHQLLDVMVEASTRDLGVTRYHGLK